MEDKLHRAGNKIAKFLGVEKKFKGIVLVDNLIDKRFGPKRFMIAKLNYTGSDRHGKGEIVIGKAQLKELESKNLVGTGTTSYKTKLPMSKIKPVNEVLLHEMLHIKSPSATEETIERRTYRIGNSPRLKRILAEA